MRLDKLNDWVKVLMMYLITSVLAVVFMEIYLRVPLPIDLYVLIGFNCIIVAYYVMAGIFLKNVKTYKVLLVFIGMFVIWVSCGINGLDSKALIVFLSGGTHIVLCLFTYFIEDILQNIQTVVFFGVTSLITPFIITYISMKIARRRDAKLAPYLEEVMKENRYSSTEQKDIF